MFRFPDWCYRRLPSQPLFWLILWIVWFSILWTLSSSNPDLDKGPELPHIDKVYHLAYFMIGGFAAANFLYLKFRFNWKKVFIIVVIAGSAVGIIDEYHQSFTPGRSGNDVGDWIADTLGAYTGCLYCYLMWQRFNTDKPS